MCFFFKQKTAYEMRISDWSSDVCSSDLVRQSRGLRARRGRPHARYGPHRAGEAHRRQVTEGAANTAVLGHHAASCTRSEERRVGKEGGSTCSSRWSPYH